jgi:hypothetical protein
MSVGLSKGAPDEGNHVPDYKINNWFFRDLLPTSRAGIFRLLSSRSIARCLQLRLNRILEVRTNTSKNLRKIRRNELAVHVICGVCANMFSECFVEPAFEASLAVTVSAVRESRSERLVCRKRVNMRTYR